MMSPRRCAEEVCRALIVAGSQPFRARAFRARAQVHDYLETSCRLHWRPWVSAGASHRLQQHLGNVIKSVQKPFKKFEGLLKSVAERAWRPLKTFRSVRDAGRRRWAHENKAGNPPGGAGSTKSAFYMVPGNTTRASSAASNWRAGAHQNVHF